MADHVLRIRMNNTSDVVDNGDGTCDVILKFTSLSAAQSARPPIAGNFQQAPCININRLATVAEDV